MFVLRILKNLYTGKNLLWQLVACLLTWILVMSGADWWYFVTFRQTAIGYFFFTAVIFGGLLPLILPTVLITLSWIKKSAQLRKVSFALFWAETFGLGVSSFYKVFTGRVQPNLSGTTPLIDTSHSFHFGFMKNGAFWGWPSSHTTVAFSMAFALITLFPNNKTLKYLSIIYACYVGLGVSMSIHWISEGVAGAIFGTMIGIAVGNEFILPHENPRSVPSPTTRSG
jgi:membrane-associated phospholipid phosphatase